MDNAADTYPDPIVVESGLVLVKSQSEENLEILKKQANQVISKTIQVISSMDFSQKERCDGGIFFKDTSKSTVKSSALVLSEGENENAVRINDKRKFSEDSSTAVENGIRKLSEDSCTAVQIECRETEETRNRENISKSQNEHENWKNYNKIFGVGLVFAILSFFVDSILFFQATLFVVLMAGLIMNNYSKFSDCFLAGKKARASRRITATRQSVVG